MKHHRIRLLGLAGLLFLMPACDPSAGQAFMQHEKEHQRGLAENPQRIALGMRPIDEKWICFRCTAIAGDEWISDSAKEAAAIKNVKRDAEAKAVSEIDVYWSGRQFTNVEGDPAPEELRVACDWKTGQISITYMGDDKALEKAIANLPPFSDATRPAYVDLVTSTAKKWEAGKLPQQ